MVMTIKATDVKNSSANEEEDFADTNIDELCEDLEGLSF